MGAASGRIDAIAFMAGLIAGVWVFAESYAVLAGFVWSGDFGAVTLADVLRVPFWVLAAALVIVAVVLAAVLRRVEAKNQETAS